MADVCGNCDGSGTDQRYAIFLYCTCAAGTKAWLKELRETEARQQKALAATRLQIEALEHQLGRMNNEP